MTGARHLRLLLIEDSADDTAVLASALGHAGYTLEITRVDSDPGLRDALAHGEFDVAITEHELRRLSSTDGLGILSGMAPDLPCVLVSGKIGEEAVGRAMRQGAVDYVAKDDLAGLPTVIEVALAEREQARARRATKQALARSARFFEAVFLNAGDAMLIVDDQRRVIDANPAAAEILATSRADLVKLRAEDLMPEAARVGAAAFWDRFICERRPRGVLELVCPDGTPVVTEYTIGANFLPDRHILVMRDIRERRADEAEIKRRIAQQEAIVSLGERALQEPRVELLMDAAVRCVATTLDVEIASVLELRESEGAFRVRAEAGLGPLPAATRIPHGGSASSQASFTVGQEQAVLVGDYEAETRFEQASILRDWEVNSAVSVPIPGAPHPFGVLEAASRTPHAFDAGDGSFLAAVAHVLGDALERCRSDEDMRQRALHDPLTGLANRTLLFDRLNLALVRAKRSGTRLAVLFLDVDHFKQLNDSLGHRAGDQILIEVGARIEAVMREVDTAARFGGDEFVVLCDDVGDEDSAQALTDRLLAVLATPFFVDGERRRMTFSVGVAMSDHDRLDGEDLLRDADLALYRSKQDGRGRWTMHTAEMRCSVTEGSGAAGSARARDRERGAAPALPADRRPRRRRAVRRRGAGALAGPRPRPDRPGALHPVRRAVRPHPAAQRVGPPGRVRPGRHLAHGVRRRGSAPIHVNFSARQLANADLIRTVQQALDATGAAARDIAIEITESAIIEQSGAPQEVIAELRRMGFRVILDDFGTGYSSLSYLEQFRIDTLKIDRTFVDPLRWPTVSAPIVTAIIGMARALGLGTVAEGVETARQTAAVAALGCQHAQGFFFARPAPAADIEALVHDDTRLRARAAEARALVPAVLEPARLVTQRS
jgi:diguanylate cyclase (GGDEF)-like protein/PAS domain S-box-containing protein